MTWQKRKDNVDKKTRYIPMEELYKVLLLQLEQGGRAGLTVTGRSMLPLLRAHRDKVELIPISDRQNKGDVILYRRENGRFILHRIVELTENGYICCGDNEAAREPVKHDQLLAVVDTLIRKGKRITKDTFCYKVYVALWVGLFPLRGVYIKVRRWCGRNYRKLRKNKK